MPPADPLEAIRKTCTCPVCLQVLGLPTCWPCGHSFCRSCSLTLAQDFSDRETNKVKCPNCREEQKKSRVERLQPNLVLRDLLVHVFGEEETLQRETEVQRQVDRLTALLQGPRAEDGQEFAGERDGEHELGWEVVLAADEYELTRKASGGAAAATVSRNVVRDQDRFTHRLCFAPVVTTSSSLFPLTQKQFAAWKLKFAVLEMEEDEVEDSGGFPPAVAVSSSSSLIDNGGDDECLVRTAFTDALMCQVSVDGEELEEIESCDTNSGVASFFLGDLFGERSEAVRAGQQIMLKITSVEEGLLLVLRFTVSPQLQQQRVLLKRQHPQVAEESAATRRRPRGSTIEVSDDSDDDGDEGGEEEEDEEEDDDDSSMDDFIADDSEEEKSSSRRRRHRRHHRDEEDDEEEDEDEENEEEEDESPAKSSRRRRSRRHRDEDEDEDDDRHHKRRKRIIMAVSDDDDDEDEDEEEADETYPLRDSDEEDDEEEDEL